MKKSLIVLPVLFLAACSQANGDGGVYHRVGQTAFEQQHGMSSALVIADDEQSVYIENSWAKTPLVLKNQGGQKIVQQDGFDLYLLEVNGKTAILTDIDNPKQQFRFEKGEQQ